jgi:hypothetical protein
MTAHSLLALLQNEPAVPAMPAISTPILLLVIACAVFFIIGMWKVFEKAGQPGWTAIIPFVNYFFLSMAAGRPAWWGILFFVPIVNLVVWFIVCFDLAKRFGRGTGFGIGLALLPVVFFMILGFGDDRARPLRA